MIPTSGGIDSAVLLRDSLVGTNHSIIAVHYEEDYNEWFKRIKNNHRKAFDRVIEYMKKRYRPFEVYIQPAISVGVDGLPFDKDEAYPAREGFTEIRSLHAERCRMATFSASALELQADEVWYPLTSWDWRWADSSWWALALEEFHKRVDIPLILPWGDPPPLSMPDKGRMQVTYELGQDLQRLVLSCYTRTHGDKCGVCIGCFHWRFYQELCEGRSLEEVKYVDDELERRAHYGKYYNDADPKTYNSDNVWDILRKLDTWRA